MDKELRQYKKFIGQEIKQINHELNHAKTGEQRALVREKIKTLSTHHTHTIRNFQHERAIHLAVTFFFAGLLLLSVTGFLLISALTTDCTGLLLTRLSLAISLILLIVELFYIRHYYHLENNTQALYDFSKAIFEIENKTYRDIDKKTQAR